MSAKVLLVDEIDALREEVNIHKSMIAHHEQRLQQCMKTLHLKESLLKKGEREGTLMSPPRTVSLSVKQTAQMRQQQQLHADAQRALHSQSVSGNRQPHPVVEASFCQDVKCAASFSGIWRWRYNCFGCGKSFCSDHCWTRACPKFNETSESHTGRRLMCEKCFSENPCWH